MDAPLYQQPAGLGIAVGRSGLHAVALALLGGVVLALYGATGGRHFPWFGLLCVCAVLGCLGYLRPRRRAMLALPLVFCVGAALAGWQWQQFQSRVPPGVEAARALVEARIDSLPYSDGAATRFEAELRVLRGGPWSVAPRRTLRARIVWPGAPVLRSGERWQLLMSIGPATTRYNPGRSAAQWQQLRQRLHAEARVLESRLNIRRAHAGGSIDSVREHLADALRARIPERDAAALLVALGVGDTQAVSPEQWRVFNATGITHLVAISGLHVTLFSLVVAAGARRCWRRVAWLQTHVRRENFAAGLGCAAAAGYALLAGFSVPTQRTLLMLVAWYALRAAARPPVAAPPLAVALIAVLLFDPLAPLGAGFWLSFVAVAVLMQGAGSAHERGQPAWRELLRAQGLVALGLLPVSLAVFGSVSLAGLLVNLLAIPLFSFALVPLVLFALLTLDAAPWLATPAIDLAVALHGWCWPWLVNLAQLEYSLWRLPASVPWLLLSGPACWLLLHPWRWPMRASALLLLSLVLAPRADALRSGEYQLTLFDTGRGLALLLRTRHHALLYDVGESWGSRGLVSAGTLVPALRSYGLARLDELLLPRLDADRAAGVVALGAELAVLQRRSGGEPRDTTGLSVLPPEFRRCEAGTRWIWDAVRIEIVAAADCSLRVRGANGAAALLLADLDAAAQAALVAAGLDPVAIVLLPKHGSALAYSAALRDATAPRYALVAQSAAGALAARVRPVLSAWRQQGAEVLVSGEQGAIEIRAGLAGIAVRRRRPELAE
jgi:competence protein ComEC